LQTVNGYRRSAQNNNAENWEFDFLLQILRAQKFLIDFKFKTLSRKTAKKEIREYLSPKKKRNVERCADILCGFTGKTLIQVYPSEILREKIFLKRFAKVIVSVRTNSWEKRSLRENQTGKLR
jgi:hypothetical protein